LGFIIAYPEAVLKIPYWDCPPADKGTNPLEHLTLSHTLSTNMDFQGERSPGKTFPRIGKRRATLRTCQAEEEALLPRWLASSIVIYTIMNLKS
jgi:hypothetical protein